MHQRTCTKASAGVQKCPASVHERPARRLLGLPKFRIEDPLAQNPARENPALKKSALEKPPLKVYFEEAAQKAASTENRLYRKSLWQKISPFAPGRSG